MENRKGEGLKPEAIELACGDARAKISTLGAEALSWRVAGRDLLWSGATSHWDRVAPVLFPCVGWSRDGRVVIDGNSYPMPVHGFAPFLPFEPIARTAASVSFELRDSEATRAHYPFSFCFRVHYALESQALRIELEARNAGARDMPYACGVHPGFAWPFVGGAQGEYEIRFSERERGEVPIIAEGGLFSSRRRAVAIEDRLLRLDGALFEREALCFLDARSRSVAFSGPGGFIHAQADGFRHWALWSRPGAPFLCIEAWTGHGDPEGFMGEFRDKPSIELLQPGETRRHALSLRFSAS